MSDDVKKELAVTAQRIRIGSAPQTDPEGQALVREFNLQAHAGPQQAGAQGVLERQGSIPVIAQYGTTVGEAAQARRTACQACRHYDRKWWAQYLARMTHPAASEGWKQTLASIKVRLIMRGIPEDKLDEALKQFGICRVLSEWIKSVVGEDPVFWPAVPEPDANCPRVCRAGAHELAVVTGEQPYGFFQPVDLDAKTIGSQRYDETLRLAQGKAPPLIFGPKGKR